MPERKQLEYKILTPMQLRVGAMTNYQFVSLTDVYNRCLEDQSFFESLSDAVKEVRDAATDQEKEAAKPGAEKRLALALEAEDMVLPDKCFNALFNKLTCDEYEKFARHCVGQRKNWKEMKDTPPLQRGPGGDCHWPDCPDERT